MLRYPGKRGRVKILVVHDKGVLGRLLLNRLKKTHLAVTPVVISDPAHLNVEEVGQWLPDDVDVIVNAMWLSDPEPAEADPEQTRHRAFSIPLAIAEHAAARNKVMIQLSTSYVFDGRKQSAYLASNPGNPIGQLGIWQWECEQAIRTVLPRHILLRTGWGLQRFIRKVHESVMSMTRLNLSSRHHGQPVASDDLARVLTAVLLQLDCGAEAWGTYQYAGAEDITQYDLALAIAALPEFGNAARVMDALPAWAPVEPENASLGCVRIRNTFGIKQQPWRTALPNELVLSGLAVAEGHDLQGLQLQ